MPCLPLAFGLTPRFLIVSHRLDGIRDLRSRAIDRLFRLDQGVLNPVVVGLQLPDLDLVTAATRSRSRVTRRYFYKVMSGVVRTCRFLSDKRPTPIARIRTIQSPYSLDTDTCSRRAGFQRLRS
jgi:hypothetical protein